MEIRGIDLFSYIDYRQYLEDIYLSRKAVDKKYTFGRWAKELGISSVSGLTMIIKGQRHPGPQITAMLIKNLELNKKEAEFFQTLVDAKKNSKGDEETFKAIVEKRTSDVTRSDRQVEFKWEMALLREMLKWSDFNTIKDLNSKKLIYKGHEDYAQIIKQMKSAKIINIENSKIYLNKDYTPQYKLDMSQFLPLHKEICELSSDSYYLPKEQRVLEHFLINVKKSELSNAKKKIMQFIDEFTEEFDCENGNSEEHQIFTLSTLFFPFTN
ncbi:TIGR02147 family protein [Halobacteriovorax sp. XZX-3]|uniref:TIGR02147 family protein n=1 Tax=unclassified Halobacteriovorax TaxID=2639665 RepID=UPI000CD07246|nr:TIGR02147 family protein [Halobacteriovorax sp. DA5]POB14323.1 hypothetical protein C0Z22_04325 [Halobacteriovorax sp. DA5]